MFQINNWTISSFFSSGWGLAFTIKKPVRAHKILNNSHHSKNKEKTHTNIQDREALSNDYENQQFKSTQEMILQTINVVHSGAP